MLSRGALLCDSSTHSTHRTLHCSCVCIPYADARSVTGEKRSRRMETDSEKLERQVKHLTKTLQDKDAKMKKIQAPKGKGGKASNGYRQHHGGYGDRDYGGRPYYNQEYYNHGQYTQYDDRGRGK